MNTAPINGKINIIELPPGKYSVQPMLVCIANTLFNKFCLFNFILLIGEFI